MNPLASHGLRLFSILCALTLLPSCVITVAEGGGHANSPEPARKKKKRRRMKKPAPSKPVTPIKSTRPDYKKRVPPKPTLVAQPPRTAPRRSTTRPAQLPAGIGEGRPDGFRPGAPAAYWIWQGPRGQWRVRTTTAKALRHFRGHVVGVTSGLSGFSPSRLELRDQLWRNAPGWAFSFKTKGHADGFTFAPKDNGCVRFDLVLGNPRNRPARVFVGRTQFTPADGHFIVCPRGRVARDTKRAGITSTRKAPAVRKAPPLVKRKHHKRTGPGAAPRIQPPRNPASTPASTRTP